MNREELDQYLRKYSVFEQMYLQKCSEKLQDSEQFLEEQLQKYQKLDQETYLFENRHFMKPEEKVAIYRHDRFHQVRPHKHEFIELCYVWAGTCSQTIEGKLVETCKGDMCIFDTQAVHSVEAVGEEDILVNILMRKEFFDAAFLSRMTKQGIVSEFLVDAVTKTRQKKHFLYFPTRENVTIRQLMEQLLLEYFRADLGMGEVLESYLVILFTELFRVLRDASLERDAVTADVKVLEMLAYIEENYEHCTLYEMGNAFGMHGNYLTALLKEKTGRSFMEHVQEQRMKKARALLENSRIPISDIVSACGYNNQTFFYQKFKETEGCTPARYRKDHQKP